MSGAFCYKPKGINRIVCRRLACKRDSSGCGCKPSAVAAQEALHIQISIQDLGHVYLAGHFPVRNSFAENKKPRVLLDRLSKKCPTQSITVFCSPSKLHKQEPSNLPTTHNIPHSSLFPVATLQDVALYEPTRHGPGPGPHRSFGLITSCCTPPGVTR